MVCPRCELENCVSLRPLQGEGWECRATRLRICSLQRIGTQVKRLADLLTHRWRPKDKKESRKACADCKTVLHHLTRRRKAKRPYMGGGKGGEYLHARHQEHGLKACLEVVDRMVEKWKGTKWEDYLRPITLFSASKFDGYMNMADPDKDNDGIAKFSPEGS